jgi:hypothetical protein
VGAGCRLSRGGTETGRAPLRVTAPASFDPGFVFGRVAGVDDRAVRAAQQNGRGRASPERPGTRGGRANGFGPARIIRPSRGGRGSPIPFYSVRDELFAGTG